MTNKIKAAYECHVTNWRLRNLITKSHHNISYARYVATYYAIKITCKQ